MSNNHHIFKLHFQKYFWSKIQTLSKIRYFYNMYTPDHLLLDNSPNLKPFISYWDINKFEKWWYKSVRILEILNLLFHQFLNFSSSQQDMSGPIIGDHGYMFHYHQAREYIYFFTLAGNEREEGTHTGSFNSGKIIEYSQRYSVFFPSSPPPSAAPRRPTLPCQESGCFRPKFPKKELCLKNLHLWTSWSNFFLIKLNYKKIAIIWITMKPLYKMSLGTKTYMLLWK
jgi:hypothetical protein